MGGALVSYVSPENFCGGPLNEFRSTKGITPAPAGALLLVLTRITVRLYSHLTVQKRRKNRVIEIHIFIDLSSQTDNIEYLKTSFMGPEPELSPEEVWEEHCFSIDGW